MESEEKGPKPVFHLGENFSSAYFGSIPDNVTGAKRASDDHKLIANFISLLTDPTKRLERSEALSILHNSNAQQFLVDLLSMKDYEKYRKELLMACWESGLDFSKHLIFFAELVIKCEYPDALEAITVIDEMHDPGDGSERERAVALLSHPSLSPEKQALVQETLNRLNGFN